MAFSLSNWFKGKPGAPGSEDAGEPPTSEGAPAAAVPAAPAAVPSAVRTVVPNSVQPISLRNPGNGSARGVGHLPVSSPNAVRAAAVAVPAARGKISFGGTPGLADADEAAPAVVAPAELADVNVSLEVGDFLDRLPPSFVQTGNVDRHRRVDFRASELYSDLTKGRASVPASVIYRKCPELFSRPIGEEEDAEVALPLQKLVEQMSSAFQTRSDQVAEENVGEIETPFLQVAMEDSARLPKAAGTMAGALRAAQPVASPEPSTAEPPRRPHRTGQISTISPLKPAPEPPPMPSSPVASNAAPINSAKRPPSTVRASVAGGKIRLSGPSMPNRMVAVPVPPPAAAPTADVPELPPSASQRILPPLQVSAVPGAPSPSHQVSKKTARIQIPPISLRGPGGPSRPASPTAVPVQTSPIPVRSAPTAEPAAPVVTFRSSPPPASARPMPHSFAPPPPRPVVPPPAFPIVPPPSEAAPVVQPATDERKISLSLAAILRGLPLSSLTVDPAQVPDDVRVSLPFALVEPQLAHGRVAVPQAVFAGALPEQHREVLASNSGLAEIPLPLQEVFQNLPPAALAIRQDQVIEEIGHLYPTPFSQKAEEDAKRFEPSTSATESAPESKADQPDGSLSEEAPAPALAVDRPLPADPAPGAESTAEANSGPAEKEAADEPETDFANLFSEEDRPIYDIPLDFGEPNPADEEKGKTGDQPAAQQNPSPELRDIKPDFELADLIPVLPPEVKEVAPEQTERTEPPAAFAESKPEPATPDKFADESATSRDENAASLAETSPVEPMAGLEPKPTTSELIAPVPAVSAIKLPDTAPAPEVVQPVAPTLAPALQDSVLQTLFMTEEDLDAKAIVRLVSALPGLEGCAVMFEDGLQLAGNFPVEADAEGFSAMAPPFFKRARNFAGEINLGALHTLSLYTEHGLISFFMHDQICLGVRHSGRGFPPGVREKLETVTRELARMYATTPPQAD